MSNLERDRYGWLVRVRSTSVYPPGVATVRYLGRGYLHEQTRYATHYTRQEAAAKAAADYNGRWKGEPYRAEVVEAP